MIYTYVAVLPRLLLTAGGAAASLSNCKEGGRVG